MGSASQKVGGVCTHRAILTSRPEPGVQASLGTSCSLFVAFRIYIVYRQSLLGPVDPSFRALSGRLKFTVRRHQFNKDSLSGGKRSAVDSSFSVCQTTRTAAIITRAACVGFTDGFHAPQVIERPNCIILAVSAANQDIANSDGLQLAREVDLIEKEFQLKK